MVNGISVIYCIDSIVYCVAILQKCGRNGRNQTSLEETYGKRGVINSWWNGYVDVKDCDHIGMQRHVVKVGNSELWDLRIDTSSHTGEDNSPVNGNRKLSNLICRVDDVISGYCQRGVGDTVESCIIFDAHMDWHIVLFTVVV